MRYLFLSNYYPPHALGGYEQWCQEVAEELTARGHEVCILTSVAPSDGYQNRASGQSSEVHQGPVVHRELYLELDGGLLQTIVRLSTERKQLEEQNVQTVAQRIEAFQPDAAMIWGMWNMPRSVPATVEAMLRGRVAYYICDYWLSLPNAYIQRWQEDARHSIGQTVKQLLGIPFLHRLENEAPVGLAIEHPICVSNALRDLLVNDGVPVGHAQILHGGTQVESFMQAAADADKPPSDTLRLVTAARLLADKGVHTILQALAQLEVSVPLVSLDVYGSGDEGYLAYLHTLVSENGLADIVTFHGSVPRANMPNILANYDAFVFSSEWQEPFARSVLEAMAAGLAVVGTTTGGTGEILVENETGLTYQAGNANTLSAQLRRLIADRELLARLARQGQETVSTKHTFAGMVDGLESVLNKLGEKGDVGNLQQLHRWEALSIAPHGSEDASAFVDIRVSIQSPAA